MPRWVHQTAVFLLAGILVTSSLAKAVSPSQLHDALYGSGLVPLPLAMPAAVAVEWLEMLTGLTLLASIRVGAWRPYSLQATLVLSASFAAFSLWRMWRGLSTPCGCIGGMYALAPPRALLLSGAMVAIAWLLLAIPGGTPARHSAPAAAPRGL